MINLELSSRQIDETGYTQQNLADAIPCARSTLINITKGHTLPSFYILSRLIEVLQLSLKEVNDVFFSKGELEGKKWKN